MKKQYYLYSKNGYFFLQTSYMFLTLFFGALQYVSASDLKSQNYETRIIERSFLSSTKTVIDEEQIKKSKANNLGTLISTQANISVTNSAFQPNSLFLRGGDSGQILILVDGLPVYDPSTVQRSFNLNSLNIKSIKKITVIKGSQSVWYGGQALSAVIKIETLPKISGQNSSVQLVTGVPNTNNKFPERDNVLRENLSAFISLNKVLAEDQTLFFNSDYQVALQPSPVLNSDFNYHKRQNSFDVGYIRQNESKFYIKANRYSDRNEVLTGVSALDFAPLDTLGFVTTNDTQQLVSVYTDSTVSLKPFLSVGLVNTHRIFNYEVNSFNSTPENQEYKGMIMPFRAELRVLNEPTTRVDMGLSYQKEAMLYEEFKELQADKSNEMTGVFTKVEHDLSKSVSATAGIRQDKDLNFKSVTTYQAGVDIFGYKLEYATGYRLPSLYQLYSNKGNGNLSPEFARTYTLTKDFQLSENLRTSFTCFETHIENQITSRTDPGTGLLKYYNNRTITKGIEGGIGFQISADDYLKASYAYQEPKDINSGRWLTKRPLHSASLGYLKQLNNQSVNLEFVGRGERQDQKNGYTYVRLPGFGIVNVSYDYEISPSLEVFARVNNLLATQYEESYGYYIRGSDWQMGLTSQF